MALSTPNLGLILWNQPTDPYDSTQLAGNWAKLDEHDHTPNKGLPITTAAIADGAITSAKLALDISVPPASITIGDISASLVQLLVPTAAVIPFAGSAAPAGFLLCDGTSLLRASYPDLFSAIGTVYGSADGTHFTLPDFRGRMAVGLGTHADVTSLANSDGAAVGNRRPKHKHTVNESAHGHGVTDLGHSHSFHAEKGPISTNFTALPLIDDQHTYQFDDNPTTTTVTTGLTVNTATTGLTVGPQTTAPTDSAGYLVINYVIKH